MLFLYSNKKLQKKNEKHSYLNIKQCVNNESNFLLTEYLKKKKILVIGRPPRRECECSEMCFRPCRVWVIRKTRRFASTLNNFFKRRQRKSSQVEYYHNEEVFWGTSETVSFSYYLNLATLKIPILLSATENIFTGSARKLYTKRQLMQV